MKCSANGLVVYQAIRNFLEQDLKFSAEACAEFKDKAVSDFQLKNPDWEFMAVTETTRFKRNSKEVRYRVTAVEDGEPGSA